MNNIIEKILEEYKRNGVIVLEATSLSPSVPDIADLISRQVVINTNSKYQAQLPFRLAHELMHIITVIKIHTEWLLIITMILVIHMR